MPRDRAEAGDVVLWKVSDVARRLGVSDATVRGKVHARELECVWVGRFMRFEPAAVADYERRNTQAVEPKAGLIALVGSRRRARPSVMPTVPEGRQLVASPERRRGPRLARRALG